MADINIEQAIAFWYQNDNIAESRNNFFFIAESMITVALFTSTSITEIQWYGLAVLGTILTFYWLYISIRLRKRISKIVSEIKKKSPTIQYFLPDKDQTNKWAIYGKTIMNSIPLLFIIFWIFVITSKIIY